MVATIVLMTTLAAGGPGSHVRSSVPRLAGLITRGVECSSTVRHLVATLDASDVIVYIEAKQRRPSLIGYLSHYIVTVAGIRYLRIYVEMQGAERQLIPIIGHELQHAVEVAQAADARTSADLKRVFDRLGFSWGCHAAGCYETRAAGDVERVIRRELHEASPSCNRDSHETSSHKACRVCADKVSGNAFSHRVRTRRLWRGQRVRGRAAGLCTRPDSQ